MTLEDQLELEKNMIAYGISRYSYINKTAEDKGRVHDTKYGQVLLREFVEPVGNAIHEFCQARNAGHNGKVKPFLRLVDPMKAAFFGLRALLNSFITEVNIQSLAISIGTMIEDEVKFAKFELEQGEYYATLMQDFKRRGTVNYRHLHRVLTFKAKEKEVRWVSWSVADKAAVGIKILDCILQTTDLAKRENHKMRNKSIVVLRPTEETVKWIKDYHKFSELINPDRMPCIIEPDDWIDAHQGGYFSPQLRVRTPLIKSRSKAHMAMFEGDISNITKTINGMQRTPWAINEPVYNVMQEVWSRAIPIGLPRSDPYIVPESPVLGKKKEDFTDDEKAAWENWKAEARIVHTLEKERVSKCFQVTRVLRVAREYSKYDKFWYVYQCDFRGRIYATTSGLSPQGADFARGLLRFARGKPLGKDGAYWLAVHGANSYGVDKLPYDSRVQWVQDNAQAILQAGLDPMNCTDFWGNADKPWQFLAFCFEYAQFLKDGENMVSYLPIGLDGSCNGLQNFSAMLRDEVGGAATNLFPADKPADIYAEVARVCTLKLRELDDPMSKVFLDFADKQPNKLLPRGIAKRPVMTLPYGSTQQSCRDYIYAYLMEDAPDDFPKELRFKLSMHLTGILWASIAQVVVAAREAMDWIQTVASVVAKANKPLIWWTPIGFPVYQARKTFDLIRIETQLCGRFQATVADDKNGVMSVSHMKLGSAPNFVHSMDACHLMLTCNKCLDAGIQDFAFVHDDYGTHAANVTALHKHLRDAFVELYGNSDPLIDFKIFNEDNAKVKLPDPPSKRGLILDQVLDSKYFFG